MEAKADAACLVGKAWDFHVAVALETTEAENVAMIESSMVRACESGFEAIYDAEHFFDGFKANPSFAVACLQAALAGGARWVVLCDTNGGTLPHEIYETIRKVQEHVPGDRLGIHAHNDTENAVANSLAAVSAGVRQVQGTLNGLGERCGNANLISLIPSLAEKMGFDTSIKQLQGLRELSLLLDDRLNRPANPHAAYVGSAAFAHKGGLHASAVMKDPRTYEHIAPEKVGNMREIIMSDQAGRANLIMRLQKCQLPVESTDLPYILDELKHKQAHGYSYDGADASFELMVHRRLKTVLDFFSVVRFRVIDERRISAHGETLHESEATIVLQTERGEEVTVAFGNGPVNALDKALRSSLVQQHSWLARVRLVDYKVRIVPPADDQAGTDALTRVTIEFADDNNCLWSTIGVSANIISASFEALEEGYIWYMLQNKTK